MIYTSCVIYIYIAMGETHLQCLVGSWAAVMIMDITYGIHGEAADPYISTAVEALDGVARAATPGAFLVDSLPFREYRDLRDNSLLTGHA